MVSLSPTESQEGQGCGNLNNGALFVLVRRFKEAHFHSLWPQMLITQKLHSIGIGSTKNFSGSIDKMLTLF
jgi:hypothetical protein